MLLSRTHLARTTGIRSTEMYQIHEIEKNKFHTWIRLAKIHQSAARLNALHANEAASSPHDGGLADSKEVKKKSKSVYAV